MAATKIILKRSSIPGKRPDTSNLEAGELAVNTNANEPGLFFEVTDGKVVKVGPTAYLPGAPTITPARGELWVDSDTKTLNIGNTVNNWQRVAAPFLGGTDSLTVFVAPDFPEATDSLTNDGQAVPFVTINRAILEVTKRIILESNSNLNVGNNRYLIVLAPSTHCVINGPGTTLANFTVNFDDPSQEVTQNQLQQFNVPSLGGLVLPRGVSIIGMDLKKCEVRPVYVPKYTHPAFPVPYSQVDGGPVYSNQPLSSIFKWSGNTYLSSFTTLDKKFFRVVDRIRTVENTGVAIFGTPQPHGLNYNDFVRVDYTNDADQGGASFSEGSYYVNPVNSFEFELSLTSWDSTAPAGILSSTLPALFTQATQSPPAKFNVANIYPYFIPVDGVSYELSNYSHHRLSDVTNCAVSDLNEFYSKVQLAFPTLFGGAVNKTVAALPEYQIVAEAQSLYPDNIQSNSTLSTSPYMNQVTHRSDYGRSNIDADGNLVTGFKSVIVNEATSVSIQKDPCAYEVYADSDQIWLTLTSNAQAQWPTSIPIFSVPTDFQLSILNQTSIPNIRYYYKTLLVENVTDGSFKSTGITDINNDFRHFGFRSRGPNTYMQVQATYTIGSAVGVWAMDGAQINLDSATSNFGSNAFQAEGFSGIGTLGGSTQVGQGFTHSGIVLPLALSEPQVISDFQKKILLLGSKVVKVELDPNDSSVTLIHLLQPFDPASILPFSLKPGSAILFGETSCTYVAYFVNDGTPTCILSDPLSPSQGAVLRVRSSDANIAEALILDTIPYIRRFIDPRTEPERSYGFYIQSTSPSSKAPQYGEVLRLNQTGKDLSTTFKRNYQFDPGQFGGISQIFSVAQTETIQYNLSLNYNNKISDTSQSTAYAVYATLGDNSGPWIQSYPVTDGSVDFYAPFNTPEGTYMTDKFRNYYCAENNIWSSLYYNTTFNYLNGPTKVSPQKSDSAFVTSAVLDRQTPVTETWQGYVPDPLYSYYTDSNLIPASYQANLTYLRGTLTPNKEFAGEYFIDGDDGSPSLGIIYYRVPVTPLETVTTTPSETIQTQNLPTSPFVTNPTFGRPAIVKLNLLQVSQLEHPRNNISVIRISDSASGTTEYLRVIGIVSSTVTAIRNYYPEYSTGTLPNIWPAGSTVAPCISTHIPEPVVYDPDWSITKNTIFRYYEIMGFSRELMAPYLKPKYAGERVLLNTSLSLSPVNGYANTPAPWPVEFNLPSVVQSTNHTWTYSGYFDYSRGLPKYQTNELSRKVSADFQSYASFGGNIICSGFSDLNEFVLSGSVREAFTLNYFQNNTPLQNINDRVLINSPQPIDYPAPVLVFSADDISGLFNGSDTSFDLNRGGYGIPASQLSTFGVFVFIGGVAQLPLTSYNIVDNVIIFTEAPPAGACCDIRVITTDDNNSTLEIIDFNVGGSFDGVTTSFILSPNETTLSNGNSLVFLGGVLQDPFGPPVQLDYSYIIDNSTGVTSLTFVGAAPQANSTIDVRGVLSGRRFRTSSVPIVFMNSTDEISNQFDGVKTSFPLTLNGVPLNPFIVNSENIFVNLGGVMQIPIANAGSTLMGIAYTVRVNPLSQALEIVFATGPLFGTSCNIRVISQEELITCPLPEQLISNTLKVGPGVETSPTGELIGIDPGIIN